MTAPARTALLCALLGSLGACAKDNGTFVVVHFLAAGAPSGIAELDLTLTLGTRTDRVTLTVDRPLPLDTSLEIADGAGTLNLVATARNAAGDPLATASAMPVIVRGQTTSLDLSFGAVLGSDAGMGSDGAPGDAQPLDGDLASDGGASDGELAADAALVPRLMGDTPSYDFGAQAQGATVTRLVTVTNLGTGASSPLTVMLSGGAGGYQVNGGCQGQSLTVGASCMVLVSFSPTSAGLHAATLTVIATAGGTVASSLTGTGLTGAALTITPPGQDFGTITQGASGTATLQVANGGGVATGALTTALTGADASLFNFMTNSCTGIALQPGATCAVVVRFLPTSTGAKQASFGVSAAGGPSGSAALTGTGQAPGALSISALTFGTVTVGMTQSVTATVTNTGGAQTGAISFSLSGGNLAEFAIVAPDTCSGQLLAGAATCMVSVRFAPTSAGPKVASLMAAATPGGPTTTSLQQAVGSAPLTVMSMGTGTGMVTSSPAGITCGATCASSFTTSPVVLTAAPDPSSTFMGWSGNSCSGTGSCSVALPAAGAVTATFALKTFPLTTGVSGTGAGSVTLAPTGSSCGAGCATFDFGTGVTLSPAPSATSDFTGWTGDCTGSGACLVTMTASRSVTAQFTLKKFLVTVTPAGSGTVTSTPAGISCPGTCAASFDLGTAVNLAAKPAVGSYFQTWGGDCSGPARLDCNLTASQARTVSAQFVTQTYNTVFLSSTLQPSNLGSALAYDGVCNTLATAAGLNNATNNAFIAWTSDGSGTSGLAKNRLGSARGFVRVDGKPFGDDLASMLSPTSKIFNSPSLDENGRVVSAYVMTGTKADGTVGNNCTNFTTVGNGTTGTYVMKGAYAGTGGPGKWTADNNSYPCSPSIVLCMMTTKVAPLTLTTTAGKKIWLSRATWLPAGGIAAANTQCNTDRPATVASGNVKALLPTVSPPVSAASWLSPTATYVRPDGQLIGTGAQIRAGGALESGMWQDGSGAYVADPTGSWAGSLVPTDVPTDPLRTCADWTTSAVSSTAITGDHEVGSNKWWYANGTASCASPSRLYCVEQ